MNHNEIPLPDYAYIPGINTRHEEGFLDHVKDMALDVTKDATARHNVTWLYGIRLLENAFYWECHEILEEVWMKASPNSREKHLVQGVIHLTNAALKIKMDRASAAKKLTSLAANSFHEAYAGFTRDHLLFLRKSNLESTIKQLDRGEVLINIMNYNA